MIDETHPSALEEQIIMLLSDDQSALSQAIDHMASNNFFGEGEFGSVEHGTEASITDQKMASAIEVMALTYLSHVGLPNYGDDPSDSIPPDLNERGFH